MNQQYKEKYHNTNLDILAEFRTLDDKLDDINYVISECFDPKGKLKLEAKRDIIANKLGILYPATKRVNKIKSLQKV